VNSNFLIQVSFAETDNEKGVNLKDNPFHLIELNSDIVVNFNAITKEENQKS